MSMSSVASSPESEAKGSKLFSSHDPACDQCRIKKIGCGRELPACSNCVKAKVQCVRSNRGKRPNQTKQLVSDFGQFGNRLNDLEKNVNRIHEKLDDFFQEKASGRILSSREKEQSNLNADGCGIAEGSVPKTVHGRDILTGYIASTQRGVGLPPGSSSLMSLFEEADEKINHQLDGMRPRASLRDILSRDKQQSQKVPLMDSFLAFKAEVYQGLSLTANRPDPDLSHDGASLLLPPKALLEPIVDQYFRHISSVVPIIGRLPCLEAIEKYYSLEATNESAVSAWTVLFNYMILFCFVGKYMPLDRPSSDVDIISITQFEMPFVANIRRAFGIMNQLLEPKLINVQALIALTLISQKYFSEHVTQYLLNQACFVAKSMGLHRHKSAPFDLTAEELDERRRVFCCLFINDKDVSLLLGTPPNLHYEDCDIAYPLQASYDFLRRFDASLILGKVYILLYSAAASRATEAELESNIDELLVDLESFQRSIEKVSWKEADSMHRRAWQFLMLEHKHTAHHIRLMILRRSRVQSKYDRRLAEARQCIKTIAKIHVARTTVGGFMVLRRPFQWRPFAAFFELLPTLFSFPVSNAQLEDVKLLKELGDMLCVVAQADDASSYCGKLLRITLACVSIANEYVQQCLSHQVTSPLQLADSDMHRKRKAGTLVDSRTGKMPVYHQLGDKRAPGPLSANLGIQSAPSTLGFEDFSGSTLMDMFSGWPKATVDSLAFLNEGLFWGEDELSPQQDTPT